MAKEADRRRDMRTYSRSAPGVDKIEEALPFPARSAIKKTSVAFL